MARHATASMVVFLILISGAALCRAESESVLFEIKMFEVSGNTLMKDGDLQDALHSFTGSERSADDVEKARNALEKFYHKSGYPTVLVNIPEQSVEGGVIRLEVIESTVRRIRVTGNRYFTMEKILKGLPSLQPGKILYLPDVRRELAVVNRSPDMKVAPVLMPGKELGTIDIELKIKDKLPLHGDVELNNRSTHDTTDLRLNASMRYDNLWQKDHSITLQYQTSPENTKEVRAIAASYVFPSPLSGDHILAVYGVISDSDTAFGQDFEVLGKGYIVGLRNIIPLGGRGNYNHNLTLGLDYKDFSEDLSFLDQGEGESISTPVTYVPIMLAYGASLPDKWGTSGMTGSLNFAFRGVTVNEEEFADKRYKTRGNYIYLTMGVNRVQNLPWGMSLFLNVDGQIADQPLIANEQYIAGGMKSVRGYKESETAGDNAVHGSVEWRSPDIEKVIGLWDPLDASIFAFYDFVNLSLNDPLPGEEKNADLYGAGAGIRGKVTDYLTYEVIWSQALKDTSRTESGDQLWYFEVKCRF